MMSIWTAHAFAAAIACTAVPLVHSAEIIGGAPDTFGSGENEFQIEFVDIGDPGAPGDPSGYPTRGVNYHYRIGKYEVSRGQIEKANAEAGLGITLASMASFGGDLPDIPATGVGWGEAALFVNWLNESTGHLPAYKFVGNNDFQTWGRDDPGYDRQNPYRNKNAYYFLPDVYEWYKAAFYDPVRKVYYDYATGSDRTPIPVSGGTQRGTAVYLQDGPALVNQAGGLSPYGTMGQGGNVEEFMESSYFYVDFPTYSDPKSLRVVRGGGWYSGFQDDDGIVAGEIGSRYFYDLSYSLYGGSQGVGFRVASVPEPTGVLLAALAAAAVLTWRVMR